MWIEKGGSDTVGVQPEQLRVYEGRDERRCIPEYEYFTTRPTCPLRALERKAKRTRGEATNRSPPTR